MAKKEAHYALDVDPADNPYQPPPDQQGEHKTGTKRHIEAQKARFAKLTVEQVAARAIAQAEAVQKGDVVFDYSSAKPSNAEFVAAGAKGVCRYLSPLNADGSDYGPTFVKVIQTPEYKWHLNNNRYVRKNYEWYEGRMGEGAPAGTQDAYWAATKGWQLDQSVGVDPATTWWARWIIFSDDTGGTPYASVKSYMLAAYAQMQKMPGKYLPDYYGRQAIYRQLLDDPDIHWMVPGWQTCAWSGGVYGGFDDPDHAAAMYQALCSPVSPNIAGCDTNFVMQPQKLDSGSTPVVGEEGMIIVQATTGGAIGSLSPYGIYHFNPAEWNSVSSIRNALPAAVRDTLMPIVKITDAQFRAISPDNLHELLLVMFRGDTDDKNQPLPEGQNTHPDNLTFISRHVNDVKKATDTVEPGLVALTAAVNDVPTGTEMTQALTTLSTSIGKTLDDKFANLNLPPLSQEQVDAAVETITQAVLAAQSTYSGQTTITLTPTPPTP